MRPVFLVVVLVLLVAGGVGAEVSSSSIPAGGTSPTTTLGRDVYYQVLDAVSGPQAPHLSGSDYPTLLGTLLSLIMAFRTGQAYDRWWEARRIWGSIVNNSRSLVRAAQGFAASTQEGEAFAKSLGLRQIAMVYTLGQSLRGLNATDGIHDFISAEELSRVKARVNVPNALLQNQSLEIKRAREKNLITDFGQLRLDEIVMSDVDNIGMCERIKGTIFPTPYNLFLHMSIYVFAVTLTLGISDFNGIIEIPATLAITAIFLAIERVALLLQDPFENNPSDIPVTALAQKIEVDIKQMLGLDDLPKPAPSNRFYQM